MKETDFYWLGLSTISGLGSIRMNKLINHFGDPLSIWKADKIELEKVIGSSVLAERIVREREKLDIEKLLERTAKNGIKYLTLLDKDYPENLKNIYDPPPVIYYKGENILSSIGISIIGSRRCTAYGKKTAEKIAYELAERGIAVISGMARGIDTHAHIGALNARGRTIAVLGSGLDIVYPPENKKLFFEIQENGAVVSEYPPGVEPLAGNFPQRNRIISGLSTGVLVVEAAQKSGSLITANLALEQGRELFAIPGNIDRQQSTGTNNLIKEGAKMVTEAKDIIEEIYLYKGCGDDEQIDSKKESRMFYPELSAEEMELVEIFREETEITVDELIRLSNKSPEKINTALIKLELKGIISRGPGKKYFFMGLQSLLKPL